MGLYKTGSVFDTQGWRFCDHTYVALIVHMRPVTTFTRTK